MLITKKEQLCLDKESQYRLYNFDIINLHNLKEVIIFIYWCLSLESNFSKSNLCFSLQCGNLFMDPPASCETVALSSMTHTRDAGASQYAFSSCSVGIKGFKWEFI